ncbi:FAD-binding oxidoreductase [bacterium]|nr:FAD-binding oxidoreductase [bacterium]
MNFIHSITRDLTKGSVFTKLIHRHSYARDAGFYRLLPKMVVKAQSKQDISTLFKFASDKKRSIVFRAAGTSLSGQAISDDILVEVKQGWRKVEVLNGGRQIKLQPGVVAAKANQHLEPLGYRIGPDPGSINAAMIGGIVANNASGIGSGIQYNSYQTLAAMEMILPMGLILNTANPADDEKFHRHAPLIYDGLSHLRDQIRKDKSLEQRIRNKYKLKNTTGYSLNSFLDHDQPIEILAHLMVGSEGTLGFISNVTLNTVELKKFKSTALLMFDSLSAAAGLVPELKKIGSYALEIMDSYALKAVSLIPGLHLEIHPNIEPGSAALLVEYQANNPEILANLVDSAIRIIREKQPELHPQFFENSAQREELWKVRRELGPLNAAMRPPGTTVLSEDICFKVKDLARAIKELQFLFNQYHFDDAIIFGHAGEGNLHFKLSLDLSQPRTVQQYGKFMNDLVDMVVDKYDGSLKAEHGTGRNVAPFVEREWGSTAYTIMKKIKQLLDPAGILNPDVLISNDEQIHLKHIKPIPLLDPIIDACIECGLCEPWCPSADFTLTPRQRINVLREIKTLDQNPNNESKVRKLRKDFNYQGIETCATDGLCELSCPINIDTGSLMKQSRANSHRILSRIISQFVQNHFSIVLIGFRTALTIFTPLRILLKNKRIYAGMKVLARTTHGIIPALNSKLRAAQGTLPKLSQSSEVDVIYFPSCLNRGFSDPARTDLSAPQAFIKIMQQAGIHPEYPLQLEDMCCGLTFSSKGFPEAALQAAIKTTELLWISSREGRIPIVMDTSPCSSHMRHYDKILSGVHLARWRDLIILDVVEYLHDVLLDKLSLWHVREKVVLHPTCSTRRMGIENKMRSVAERCAREVVIPNELGCCAFAGDRGLLFPDLTARATAAEAFEAREAQADGHYSSSHTCEIGMSLATDKNYQSLIYLVHDALIQSQT